MTLTLKLTRLIPVTEPNTDDIDVAEIDTPRLLVAHDERTNAPRKFQATPVHRKSNSHFLGIVVCPEGTIFFIYFFFLTFEGKILLAVTACMTLVKNACFFSETFCQNDRVGDWGFRAEAMDL